MRLILLLVSLLGIALDEAAAERPNIVLIMLDDVGFSDYGWAWLDNRALRDGRWKIAWDQNVGRWELYDIDSDRVECRDLAESEPERLRTMIDDWRSWAERTGAAKRLGQKIHLKR